jgi:dienelactone hydrolase
MDRADVNKIAFTGFSMGGQEVIHAQARYPEEAKAMVIVSGSMQIPLANAIGCVRCSNTCATRALRRHKLACQRNACVSVW